MPDRRIPEPNAPMDWPDAFAALPPETPPGDGWVRVAARLPVRRKRTRWPSWIATAAALAMVAVVPLKLLDAPDEARTATSATAELATAMPATSAATPDRLAAEPMTHPPFDEPSPPATSQGKPTEPTTVVAQETARPVKPNAAAVPDLVDAPPARAAVVDTPPEVAPTRDTPASPMTEPPEAVRQDAVLERLYAESAQLEALLAMARDDSVASGPAATLASGFDAQVASIDAALSQPGLDADMQSALWRDRIHALRQAATFASTLRVLAAQGERYDAMLVSID